MPHHNPHQFLEAGLPRIPAQQGLGLGGVAQELFHLGRAEIFGVYLYQHPACAGVDTFFMDAFTFPTQVDAGLLEGQGAELADGVHLARGDDEVLGSGVLQDEPHALYVVLGIAPVAAGVQVAQVELVLQAPDDAGGGQRNLAGDEGFAPALALVVEEDAVDGEHPVTLAIVLRYPEAVLFGHAVGAARIEGGRLPLGNFLYLAEEFGGGGLVDFRLLLHAQDADGFQHAQGAHGIGLGRVFGHFEADLHVALGGQVVDFVGLHLLDDADEAATVRHVAIMQVDQALLLHVAHPLVEVEVFDAPGVKRRRAAQDAVHFISFLEEEFGQERTVLACDA